MLSQQPQQQQQSQQQQATTPSSSSTSSSSTPSSSLSSTTAPGKVFTSRLELQEHYKSDWHRYNLKRREAGLPLLNESDFHARLEAALALRQERQPNGGDRKTSHLKQDPASNSHKKHKKYNMKHQQQQQQQQQGATSSYGATVHAVSQAAAYDRIKNPSEFNTSSDTSEDSAADATMDQEDNSATATPEEKEEELPEIDPCQSLFDSTISTSVDANVRRMHQLYGFFLPDQEYLIDLEGLLGYAQEKIKLGHTCLYCQKLFSSWQACQRHMVSLRHTKLKYERGVDLDEWDVFYDFTTANEEFYQTATCKPEKKMKKKKDVTGTTNAVSDKKEENEGDAMEEGDEGDWEDVSDDDDDDAKDDQVADDMNVDNDATNNENEEDDVDMYAAYQDEIAKYGFDVTPLGELVLPDGRIIGHRGLARYYKQRLPLSRSSGPNHAVAAARMAAGERIVHGRVYQLNASSSNPTTTSNTNLALTQHSMMTGGIISSHPRGASANIGRAGKGILVPAGSGSFTALSLYRYRAVVRKQRRDDRGGRRLYERSFQNINRMDKKANNLMNGVSVAHALR